MIQHVIASFPLDGSDDCGARWWLWMRRETTQQVYGCCDRWDVVRAEGGWRVQMFCFHLLLPVLMLLHTHRALAGSFEQNGLYVACLATPSTCTSMCVPPSSCPSVSPGRSCRRTRHGGRKS